MADKIYIFVRRDLNMRRGKEIAQACHAVLGLGAEDRAIITLKVQSEEALQAIERTASAHGLQSYLVRDGGHTEVPEGTPTCIAVLGAPEDGQFSDYKLY